MAESFVFLVGGAAWSAWKYRKAAEWRGGGIAGDACEAPVEVAYRTHSGWELRGVAVPAAVDLDDAGRQVPDARGEDRRQAAGPARLGHELQPVEGEAPSLFVQAVLDETGVGEGFEAVEVHGEVRCTKTKRAGP